MTRPILKMFELGLSVDGFDCGDSEINDYLKKDIVHNAIDQHNRQYTKVYVICLSNRVIAYSTLACYHLFMELPDDEKTEYRVPGIILGRLGVDINYRKKNLGQKLIDHAISIAHEISKVAACRIVWTEAYDDFVKYYGKRDFDFVERRSENRNMMALDLVEHKNHAP